MHRDTSVVVWLPDYKTNLVIDAEKLRKATGYSLSFVAIWERETNLQKDVAGPEIAHYTAFREVANSNN